MSIAPTYCPHCLAAGVVATATGPTCTHQSAHNASWFPDWWTHKAFDHGDTEKRRTDWLRLRNPA